MKIKKTTKSITMSEGPEKQLKEMSEYYGHNTSAMIQITISEYFGGKYRIARFGHQKGVEKKDTKLSVNEKITIFESLTDDEANEFLNSLEGFYTDNEREEKEFIIGRDEANQRVRTMRYKNGSGGFNQPFQDVVNEYRKYLLTNK